MTARISAHLWVNALIRRVNTAGGFAAVIAKGDESAGGVILVLMTRGQPVEVLQRINLPDGGFGWQPATGLGTAETGNVDSYLDRQRKYDPDLWIIELDIPHPERFIGEPILNR